MPLTPNVDYIIVETATLTPVPYGEYYSYDFGIWCCLDGESGHLGSTATTSFSFCNLTSDPITIDGSSVVGGNVIVPDLTSVTISGNCCYEFDVIFVPDCYGDNYAEWTIIIGRESFVFFIFGYAETDLLSFENDSCFLDFGNVGLSSYITATKEITNNTGRDIYISFSGDTGDFITNTTLLSPGLNYVTFGFNPQPPAGDKTTTIILSGDCADIPITLCGYGNEGNSVLVDIDFTASYVGCCSDITVYVSNNIFNSERSIITITDITTDRDITTTETFPVIVSRGTCAEILFRYCPIVSGITTSTITVNYTYQSGEIIFEGTSQIEIELSGFTHPFSTVSLDCIEFRCLSAQAESTILITNPGSTDFTFYYYFEPNNGYVFNDIFTVSPDSPIVIPANSSSGLTITLDPTALTSGTSFSNVFYLNLVDPDCCRELTKCINISFCPTTITPNYGYPRNVSCYGGCDGEYSFYVTDCSGGYNIVWSAQTTTPIGSETGNCVLVNEDGYCYFTQETSVVDDYTNELTGTNLLAGNYTITLTNSCSAVTTHNFTITEPDPLYLEITWTNPANYCKTDIQELCGIVNSPNINPAGYVVIDKETLIKVVNNDFHDIPGQEKRGYQQYAAGENEISHGNRVDPINSFRNYVLDFFSGPFSQYKTKWKKEESLTIKSWNEIVSETIGNGCCFASYVSGGTSPYYYQWYGPRDYTSTSPNIFDRPCCEEYTLVVTDSHGCTITATSTCLQCSFGIESLTTINPTCLESNDGSISVTVSGNCPDAIYTIQLESTSWVETYTASTATFSNLYKGDYILNIENIETECRLDPLNITLTPKYLFTVTENITGTTCLQSCDGIIEVNINITNNEEETESVFLYTLDGQYQTSNIFSGICSGNHTLNVMNTINYCESTKIVNVPNLALFEVTTDVIPATGPKESDGEIIITVVNGQSICEEYECYELVNTEELPNGVIFSDDGCVIISEEDNCVLEYELSICRELITFTDGQYIIRNVKPGSYYYILTDNRGCQKIFKVVVGWSIIKKPEETHFDSRRIDTYGGSKITSNTPKGQ